MKIRQHYMCITDNCHNFMATHESVIVLAHDDIILTSVGLPPSVIDQSNSLICARFPSTGLAIAGITELYREA